MSTLSPKMRYPLKISKIIGKKPFDFKNYQNKCLLIHGWFTIIRKLKEDTKKLEEMKNSLYVALENKTEMPTH